MVTVAGMETLVTAPQPAVVKDTGAFATYARFESKRDMVTFVGIAATIARRRHPH